MENQKIARTTLKYLRIGPRKVRLVLDTIRYKGVVQAMAMLRASNKKAASFIFNAVKTAAANAKVLKMDFAKLYVSEAKADGGPTMKRFMTRSMGRADRMLRRTSHIVIAVKEGKKDINPVIGEGSKKEVAETKTKAVKTKKSEVKKEEAKK